MAESTSRVASTVRNGEKKCFKVSSRVFLKIVISVWTPPSITIHWRTLGHSFHPCWHVVQEFLASLIGDICMSLEDSTDCLGELRCTTWLNLNTVLNFRMNSGERYDPKENVWTSIKEMYHPRSNFGLEIIDDMILAIGGWHSMSQFWYLS